MPSPCLQLRKRAGDEDRWIRILDNCMNVQDTDFDIMRLYNGTWSEVNAINISIANPSLIGNLLGGTLSIITTYTDGSPKTYFPGPTSLSTIEGIIQNGILKFMLNPSFVLPTNAGNGFIEVKYIYKINYKIARGNKCYFTITQSETFGS